MERTVILADGDFPKKGGEALRILRSASRVIACDGAALKFRRHFHRWPEFTIGDLDSVGSNRPEQIIFDDDDNTNDLEKALNFCRSNSFADPIVIGASGKREDHTIGNIFRALKAGVRMCTETGDFFPVFKKRTFRTFRSAGVSIFTCDPKASMKSRGLRWKLDGVKFDSIWRATLNRAASENFTVESNCETYVFIERSKLSRRVVVSLGSNLGNRNANLKRALSKLSRLPKTRLVDVSSIIETNPVGVPSKYATMKFLNMAALLETELGVNEFFALTRDIENNLGRVRTVKNGPRTIDIDLIQFEGVESNTSELTLPHPRAALRQFVVEPLREIGLEVGKW
ncbi:MAG: 2-amino-4-hydroxy-6-hydroxymethyldihydropteridine diphosphokinase [Kiritimatiellae bacterium]|nr:2-amino-4-hydroxy-6-hydroxymethyldihydropteridine diphosphokinase [Kiritimatiellia bacterium]